MPDKLPDFYKTWLAQFQDVEPNLYQAFQGGFSGGAAAMRERAQKISQEGKASNEVINKIGSLPDIPE